MNIDSMIIAVVVLGYIVFSGELLWRKKIVASEISRKFIHIFGGLWIAVWPFFLDFKEIQLLASLMFLILALSKYLKLFRSIHSVKRDTYGELLFPLGILLTSLITQNKWVFFVAIAHLALADGLAAVVGKKWGGKVGFHIGHEKKTVLGSLVFLLCSLLITSIYVILSGDYHHYMSLIVVMPITLSIIENLTIKGLDNILVPIAVVLLTTI